MGGVSRRALCAAVAEWLEPRTLLAGTAIPWGAVNDILVDNAHNILFGSSSTGELKRYDLAARTILPSWPVGGNLDGMDITPDGSALYISDRTSGGTVFYRKVDITTGAVTLIPPDGSGE